VVDDSQPEYDLKTPLVFMPGADLVLRLLKASGHVLILSSGRSNLALREDWQRNPLWAKRLEPFDQVKWAKEKIIHQARYDQMLDFIDKNLPDVFAYIDNGNQGKISADVYLDDKAIRMNGGWLSLDWPAIGSIYGVFDEPEEASANYSQNQVHERSDDRGGSTREVGISDRREVRMWSATLSEGDRDDASGRTPKA
jgi:hypothetical protein